MFKVRDQNISNTYHRTTLSSFKSIIIWNNSKPERFKSKTVKKFCRWTIYIVGDNISYKFPRFPMSNINNEIQTISKEQLSIKNFTEFSLIFFLKSIFILSFPEISWDFSKKFYFSRFFQVCLKPDKQDKIMEMNEARTDGINISILTWTNLQN